MNHIFEVIDKTRRKIRLTRKQWEHITSPISPHAYMINHLDKIEQTLVNPDKTITSVNNDSKVNYYKYYKNRKQYLKIIVKYLNGEGFVITAHFVKNIN